MKVPKYIKLTIKITQFIYPRIAVLLAAKLFTTPIKFKPSKDEERIINNAKKEKLYIDTINRTIQLYRFGHGEKKVLIVHGWSGRGTQLYKIIESFPKDKFTLYSFDAPAHGKSKGNTTMMIEFIDSIFKISDDFGPFDIAIGHSLGGMSIINAIKNGLDINKAIIIGSGDKIDDIIQDFAEKISLKEKFAYKMKNYFEKKYKLIMDEYNTSHNGQKINTPILIIHDQDDKDVSVNCAKNIHKSIPNSKLIITSELGHRKILKNHNVINEIRAFLNE